MPRKPGTDTNFRRSLPEFGCLLGWAFGPRNFMKNCPSGDGALRGLTRLPWISGAFGRKFAASLVCPRFPEPGPQIGFSPLSQGLPNGTGCLFVVSPKRLSTHNLPGCRIAIRKRGQAQFLARRDVPWIVDVVGDGDGPPGQRIVIELHGNAG